MVDLKPNARLVRCMAASMATNLDYLPADKLEWKPTPEAKSALQVTAEVIGVIRMILPIFRGEDMQMLPFPKLGSLEEAKALLADTAESYATALENAGPELERVISTPLGEMWALQAVLFGLVDLLHHHGQVTYIQSLLGDAENHLDRPTVLKWFGREVPA